VCGTSSLQTVNICLRPASLICECSPLNDVTFEHLLNRLLEFLCGGPPQICWAEGGGRLLQWRTWQTSVDVFCSCHLLLSPAWDLMVQSLTSHIFFIANYHLFSFEVSESPVRLCKQWIARQMLYENEEGCEVIGVNLCLFENWTASLIFLLKL
jgi:hypothetical protein